MKCQIKGSHRVRTGFMCISIRVALAPSLMCSKMSLFIVLLILSTVPLVQSRLCLTFDYCISITDYLMRCLDIPVELPHQQPIPCTLTELEIIMEDPDELEYLQNGQPNLTQISNFIFNVKTARMNATFRPMMPYLFTIKLTTATRNNPCFPPLVEQNVMIYCTPQNTTMQPQKQFDKVKQHTSTMMQTVVTESLTNISISNLTTNAVALDNTRSSLTTSTTPMLSMTTQDELPMSISTATINPAVVQAGFGIIDGQEDYDDRQGGNEHKARDGEPRTDLDYSIPSNRSTQSPYSRFDNVHFIEWFTVIGMMLILVLLGVLTIYFRSLRQQFRQLFDSHQPGQHSMSNQPRPDSLDIKESTAFELLER